MLIFITALLLISFQNHDYYNSDTNDIYIHGYTFSTIGNTRFVLPDSLQRILLKNYFGIYYTLGDSLFIEDKNNDGGISNEDLLVYNRTPELMPEYLTSQPPLNITKKINLDDLILNIGKIYEKTIYTQKENEVISIGNGLKIQKSKLVNYDINSNKIFDDGDYFFVTN